MRDSKEKMGSTHCTIESLSLMMPLDTSRKMPDPVSTFVTEPHTNLSEGDVGVPVIVHPAGVHPSITPAAASAWILPSVRSLRTEMDTAHWYFFAISSAIG